MIRRILIIMSVGALMPTLFGLTQVHAKIGEEAQLVDKVRTSIAKLCTGKDAQFEVKLRDDIKLKGYVREATEDPFTIRDSRLERPERWLTLM